MISTLKARFEYCKCFFKQIDDGDWFVDKYGCSSYAINCEDTAFYITNKKTKQKLWIANGFMFFSDYNYYRPCDVITVNVFGIFKLAAWVKATPLIVKARIHNFNIMKLKFNRTKKAAKIALSNVINIKECSDEA